MPGTKEVAPGRYRADLGRTYDDFVVGHVYEHRPGRTVTEADNVWFTLLTMNQHPLHFDAAYAAETEFSKPLVNSCLTFSIVTGMSVADVSQKAIANLGWSKVELTAPVFVGDAVATLPIWTVPHVRMADQIALHGDGMEMAAAPTVTVQSALCEAECFVVIHQEADIPVGHRDLELLGELLLDGGEVVAGGHPTGDRLLLFGSEGHGNGLNVRS